MKATIHGNVPSKSNCYRIVRFGQSASLAKTKALTQYEKDFFIQCTLRDKQVAGYFEFYMDVYYPNQRSDLDNSLKVVLDCLQKCGAIVNDNKCTLVHARKFLDKANPRIEIEIRPVV